MKIVDRLVFSADLCKDKKVLDIGGALMPESKDEHTFVKAYKKIAENSSEYRIIDCRELDNVQYVLDFNKKSSIDSLRKILDEYKPEVILCMETLEHINYHEDVLNEIAYAIENYNSVAFITIPNNENWLLNAIKPWRKCHILAFFKDVAWNFISQSDLGKFDITQIPCIGKYFWWWIIFYVCSFCQPISWGFLIKKK